MIRIVRISLPSLLIAGVLIIFFLVRDAADKTAVLVFAVVCSYWLILPVFEPGTAGSVRRAGMHRILNIGALTIETGIVAVLTLETSEPLAHAAAIIAELLVLIMWALTVAPGAAAAPDGAVDENTTIAPGRSFAHRRAVRLGVAIFAGGGSALGALGLSVTARAPFVVIVLIGSACLVLIILLIRQGLSPITAAQKPQRDRGDANSGI